MLKNNGNRLSAALLERRLSFKKHSGVRANFHKEFIKKGLLEVKWGKFYDHVFEDRQESGNNRDQAKILL